MTKILEVVMHDRWWKLLMVASILLSVFGQALAADNQQKDSSQTGYTIGPGDVLMISIWKDESLTQEVVVLPDGTISYPLIGIVKVQGKTIPEIKAEIETRIKKYVPDPVLWVSVKTMNSAFIYVLGRVNNPGRFLLNSRVNVLQGLAAAGGLTPFANSNDIKIFRTEEGGTKLIRFRYDDVIKGKNLEENITLDRGDVIIVP
jgi:polysaccharide biosynthesis/export protein